MTTTKYRLTKAEIAALDLDLDGPIVDIIDTVLYALFDKYPTSASDDLVYEAADEIAFKVAR